MNTTEKIPKGIGPHEGRELALMLAGQKPMAMFSDVVPASFDMEIKDFFLHVRTGALVHFEEVYVPTQDAFLPMKFVYFAVKGEEWRIEQMRNINREVILFGHKMNEAQEKKVGHLLGYTPQQVTAYILWQRRRKTQDNLL